jgi:hypothetical protein
MFMQGTINITEIIGRHGPFNVAKLKVPIGTFSVKDSRIEQFKEGEYEGEFDVTSIYPGSYAAAGRLVVEVRALIGAMKFSDTGKPNAEEEPSFHVDPLDEQPTQTDEISALPEVAKSVIPKPKCEPEKVKKQFKEPQFGTKKIVPKVESKTEPTVDAELFGDLWPLAQRIKLDSTLPRMLLRQQSQRLAQLDYVFDAQNQTFNKAVGTSV